MNRYGARDLASSFQTVRKNTIAIAEDIPADEYGFKATPEVRSVAEQLAHIAVSPGWQIFVQGDRVTNIDFALCDVRRTAHGRGKDADDQGRRSFGRCAIAASSSPPSSSR